MRKYKNLNVACTNQEKRFPVISETNKSFKNYPWLISKRF